MPCSRPSPVRRPVAAVVAASALAILVWFGGSIGSTSGAAGASEMGRQAGSSSTAPAASDPTPDTEPVVPTASTDAADGAEVADAADQARADLRSVWVVVGALVAVALGLLVLLILYVRATNPARATVRRERRLAVARARSGGGAADADESPVPGAKAGDGSKADGFDPVAGAGEGPDRVTPTGVAAATGWKRAPAVLADAAGRDGSDDAVEATVSGTSSDDAVDGSGAAAASVAASGSSTSPTEPEPEDVAAGDEPGVEPATDAAPVPATAAVLSRPPSGADEGVRVLGPPGPSGAGQRGSDQPVMPLTPAGTEAVLPDATIRILPKPHAANAGDETPPPELLARPAAPTRRRRVEAPAKALGTPDAERVLVRPGRPPVRVPTPAADPPATETPSAAPARDVQPSDRPGPPAAGEEAVDASGGRGDRAEPEDTAGTATGDEPDR